MTRTRKLTLSIKEFGHLVSESLEIANATSSHPFVDNTVFSQKPHNRQSSFQRIFSRPTPVQHQDPPERAPEDHSETTRKVIAWPFSRSPRKSIRAVDEHVATETRDDVYNAVSPYSVTSFAAASSSSLGSLVPAHERLFHVTAHGSREPNRSAGSSASSPEQAAPLHASEPPSASRRDAAAITLDAIFGNESADSVLASSVVELDSAISNQSRTSFAGTDASHSVANSRPESSDEDPTPRASTFGPRAAFPLAESRNDQAFAPSWRSQPLVRSRSVNVLALRPAVGVAPHAPSETESSVSLCSTSSLASTAARPSSPASGSGAPSPPNPRTAAILPDTVSPSNPESVPALGFSPRQRKPAMSRSMTPPPLPRPPPTGPLPAVPSSPVPPVPPLPPLLHKIAMNGTSHSLLSSSPRPTIAGAPANPPTALPPSPPGGLRLPSRLSWVSGVRAVLPSPPASPTKSIKSSTGKTPPPTSLSKAENRRPHELKRPTSIGVIEATDNVQVRRTKSILLLGSRSKSNTSLCTKRVQIHADVNPDAGESRKPRRKSSAPTVGHPICTSDSGPVTTPTPSSELLVLRERRHSAPILTSMEPKMPDTSADWTLSLPFCTDVPGNKILLSSLLTPPLKLEDGLKEDWTLCMPLKVRVDTSTVEKTTEGRDSESTLAKTPEGAETQAATQLPTPCPSPTWSPPAVARPLDPEESMPVDRPASPASLGPHVGGLDLAGGRGKRASGWHVYGWFDEVNVREDECGIAPTPAAGQEIKSHVAVFRRAHEVNGRHPSQDSTSSASTSETVFYSARSSLIN